MSTGNTGATARVVVAFLAVGSTPQIVRADDAAKPERTLEEVVVTAQKRSEALRDVPISISVMKGEELDKSTSQGISEELTKVPGVTAFPSIQGGGTVVAIRGVSASSPVFAGASPTAYYVDGVPFGLVSSSIAPDANAYDLDRVEVLRGPQGTLYGASALNGVVRILTKDPDLNNFDVKVRGLDSTTDSGGNNYRGDMAVNVPIIQGKLAARADVSYDSLSGWIDKDLKNNANDAILRNTRLKLSAQPTEELSIGLSAWLSRQDYGAQNSEDVHQRSQHLIPGEFISVDYGAYGLKVRYDFPAFSVESTSSYLNYINHEKWDYGVDFISTSFSYPIIESFNAHVFAEEVNLGSTQKGPWRWTAGAIYRDAKNTTFQELPPYNGIPLLARLAWTDGSKSYAMYGEVTRLFFDEKLELTVGGRYFHDEVSTKEDPLAINAVPGYREEASFNSTTPRLVLTWHPNPTSTIYTSYSEGFRSGAPSPYYVSGGVPGVPPVKPDKLHNYEFGAKADFFDHRVSTEMAVYYMDWKDVQQQLVEKFSAGSVDTFVTAIVNGQSASGPGVDFELTVRPVERLELGASISWNDLTVDSDVLSSGKVLFKKGSRLNLSAKYTAGASAAYSVPLGGTGFQVRSLASASYSSPMAVRSFNAAGLLNVSTGDYLANLHVGFTLQAPDHWEASVFADNLTNERGVYYGGHNTNPTPGAAQDGLVGLRPRTIGLQFDYKY